MINSNDELDFEFKTKLDDNLSKNLNTQEQQQQQQQQQQSLELPLINNNNHNSNSNYDNYSNIDDKNDEQINNTNNKEYGIFVDDNFSELDIVNKVENNNEINNNIEYSNNNQSSFDSTNLDDMDELVIDKIATENQDNLKQQILDLDEDAFYFTDSLLANNLQVALWRRELEQRLNPASPSMSPNSQQIAQTININNDDASQLTAESSLIDVNDDVEEDSKTRINNNN